MKLVRDPSPAVRQAIHSLQESFSRLTLDDLSTRSKARNNETLNLARRSLRHSIEKTLIELGPEEALRMRSKVDGSLLLQSYDLAVQQATPLDSPLDLAELFDLWEETQTGLSRWGRDFDHADLEIVMATALHRSHNARAFQVEGNGPHIIMFHDRLLDLLNELAALAASVLPADDTCFRLVAGRRQLPDDIAPSGPEKLDALHGAATRFVRRHALHEWQEKGLRLTQIEDPRGDLAFDLYQAMKFFVMGHEMAHIFLKHDRNGRQVLALRDPEAKIDVAIHEFDRERKEELQADMVGLHVGMLSATANGVALPTYFLSVLLFFAGVDWVERAEALLQGRRRRAAYPPEPRLEIRDTHPPLATRRAQVRKAVAHIGEGRAAYAPRLVDLLDSEVRRVLDGRAWRSATTGNQGAARSGVDRKRRTLG